MRNLIRQKLDAAKDPNKVKPRKKLPMDQFEQKKIRKLHSEFNPVRQQAGGRPPQAENQGKHYSRKQLSEMYLSGLPLTTDQKIRLFGNEELHKSFPESQRIQYADFLEKHVERRLSALRKAESDRANQASNQQESN